MTAGEAEEALVGLVELMKEAVAKHLEERWEEENQSVAEFEFESTSPRLDDKCLPTAQSSCPRQTCPTTVNDQLFGQPNPAPQTCSASQPNASKQSPQFQVPTEGRG